MKIVGTSRNDITYFKDLISVLLVTATDVESREVLDKLSPLPDESHIVEVFVENQTYYLGVLGLYGVVMVQSGMGSVGVNGSLITTIDAVRTWDPKAVIMIGIAFGINSKKQHIGDVIVSSHIIPYENSRVGNQVIYRSEFPPASTILVNRVKQIRDWVFPIEETRNAQLFLGPLLTGEKLIDDLDFKTRLITAFPNAIGGEMEGAGLYAASSREKKEWIIIKGICDFADGNKSKNKGINQNVAIKSAVNFTTKLLTSQFAFGDLEFKPIFGPSNFEDNKFRYNRLEELLAFFASAIDKDSGDDRERSTAFKVAARQVVQTVDNKYAVEASTLEMLIPPYVLDTFESRIRNCWDMFNEVLVSDNGYLPGDIDHASESLGKCICRELKRLKNVNGKIPDGTMQEYWTTYECESIS